jgi:uncharacterized protein YegP (UPF0339 family)
MRFVIDQNNDGEFHWRLTGDDGADLAVSPTSFASATAACRAAADVHQHAGSAPAPEDNPVLLSAASGLGWPVPFTARQLGEVPAYDDASHDSVYDVQLPYGRLGRCRVSEAVGVDVGTGLEQVAAALSIYETRHGRAATASQLLGTGVDLGSQDGPEKITAT